MSYDANVLRRATQRLEEERRARSDRAARLRQEAYEKEPRLAQLDKKLQGTMSQLMAAALRRGESTAQAIQAIRAQNQDIQKERAEAHIQRLTQLRSREGEVLRLLDIPARPLVEREKTYIAAWDDMGFDDEAIRMAYEKTVLKKRSMDWGYMNGILRRWHEKGLHTAAAIQAGDRDPRPVRAGGGPQPPQPAAQEQQAREDMDRMRRLMEQMKREEG